MRLLRRRRTTQMGPTWTSYDMRRDLGRPGCVACRGASRSVWRYLDALLWEQVTDPGVRLRLRASHGFCREHTRMVVAVASAASGQLGLAILGEDLLRHVWGDLEVYGARLASERGWRRWRRARISALDPTARCPACEVAGRTAQNVVRDLAKVEPDLEVSQRALEGTQHICLPHLRLGLARATSQAEAERLIDIYRAGDLRLRRDLAEFIRKRDYRCQHERTTENEGDAYARAMRALVGERQGSERNFGTREPG